MLESLRRLLRRGPKPQELSALESWAGRHGHSFRRVREGDGCIIEGQSGVQAWRIEWGASQRSYIEGFELRMMAELGLPKELMVLVLNRVLMEAMEKAVYEHFVDDVQTRIDTETPPEMRWLVMFGKLSGSELGRLRDRYAAVASIKPWLTQWLGTSLNDALVGTIQAVPAGDPVVLTIARGRLTLRTAMDEPDAERLATWFSVFEHALREGKRLGVEWQDNAGAGLTTQPSTWSQSELRRGDGDA
jgi:hypothetical protein